jgi:glyoxalase family protein
MSGQKGIIGLHHVAAITSGAQSNPDFYTTVLGLRLVRSTVTLQAPDTEHFHYGEAGGSPGSLSPPSSLPIPLPLSRRRP